MKFLLPLFLCSSLFAQNITNLYVGQQLSVGMQLTTVPSAVGPTNILGGLIVWSKFGEGTGSTTADSSGNGNTVTFYGGYSWTNGFVGPYAVTFDGINGNGSLPYNSTLNVNTFTISCWVYCNVQKYQHLIARRSLSNYPFDLWIGGTGYKLRIGIVSGAGPTQTYMLDSESGTTLSTGVWYHCVGVYDGSSIITYLNGVQDNSDAASGTLFISTDVLNYARAGADFSNTLNGGLDSVRLYNRALSAGEVLDLYNFEK